MRKSNREIGLENQANAVLLASRLGGWATADLVGSWVFSGSQWAGKLGARLVRRMVASGVFLPRDGGELGQLFVTTRRAAEHFSAGLGQPIFSGAGWGRVRRGEPWCPPQSIHHDLRAARFLVSRLEFGYAESDLFFDSELRREALPPDDQQGVMKHPDGLIHEGQGIWSWIEVEHARKDGRDMHKLCATLAEITRTGKRVATPTGMVRATQAIVVLPPADLRDRRGYRMDRVSRLVGAMQRLLAAERAEHNALPAIRRQLEVALEVAPPSQECWFLIAQEDHTGRFSPPAPWSITPDHAGPM